MIPSTKENEHNSKIRIWVKRELASVFGEK